MEKNVSMNQLFELQEAHFEIFQIFAIFFVKIPVHLDVPSKSDLKTPQHLLRGWPDWSD